jgi:hypothetical protein
MTSTTWHAPPDVLERFAGDPGGLDDVTAASVEAHLVACADCRRVVARAPTPALVDETWAAIADVIDRPRPNLVERLLELLGLPSTTARLLGATAPLRAAGLVATLVVAAGAVALSRRSGADGPFLVLAPLAPLAAIAASFAPVLDPGGEAGMATPLHGAGLVLRRAAAVLSVTFLALGCASFALPNLSSTAAAWVLPSLALTLGALALSTWVPVEAAAWGLGGAWVLGLLGWRWHRGWSSAIDAVPIFDPVGQAAAALLAVAAAAVLVRRRDRLAVLEGFR